MKLLLIIVAYVNAHNTVTISCTNCYGGICLFLNGGGFDYYEVRSSSYSSCSSYASSQGIQLPFHTDFICNSYFCNDDDECLIEQSHGGSGCSTSSGGQQLIANLDYLYSQHKGNSTKYDWCGCGGHLSPAAIIGIIIGCIIFVIALIACICYCVKKRR